MTLSKEVGLGPGHIVLDGDPVGTQPPHSSPSPLSAHAYCGSIFLWKWNFFQSSNQYPKSAMFC